MYSFAARAANAGLDADTCTSSTSVTPASVTVGFGAVWPRLAVTMALTAALWTN